MAKQNDKHSMAKDYIAQMEWENSHPLDQRGRPSWRYQPKWTYKRVYPHTGKSKIPAIVWIIIVVTSVTCLGFVIFIATADYPGVWIVAFTVLLSILAIFYFLARGPK